MVGAGHNLSSWIVPPFSLKVEGREANSIGTELLVAMALAPLSPLTPREGGLFFVKFFTELDLHSLDRISAGIVRFSYAKARHLLDRRHMRGKIGVRF